MSVNLTKPFQGREYTPVHLMDEEESIQRSSLTTAAPDKLPSYTPEHIAYETKLILLFATRYELTQ